jgi:ATP-dependent protease Clp ATPase subunit
MLEIMYELPSMENLKEVVINEEVIRGQAQPVLLPLNEPGVPA